MFPREFLNLLLLSLVVVVLKLFIAQTTTQNKPEMAVHYRVNKNLN